MWTIAAPARAASIAESAIWAGVTGTCSLLAAVSPAPVTAHVTKTSQFMRRVVRDVNRRCTWRDAASLGGVCERRQGGLTVRPGPI